MSGLGLLRIYSSPVLRALQTAQTVQQAVGVPLHISDALREYSVGSFEDTDCEENWRRASVHHAAGMSRMRQTGYP